MPVARGRLTRRLFQAERHDLHRLDAVTEGDRPPKNRIHSRPVNRRDSLRRVRTGAQKPSYIGRLHRNLSAAEGRIYLVLPAQQPGPLSASWITQGRFMPGQIRSGNRVLVYAGPITTPFMEDVFKFQFSVNGNLVQRAFPVTYRFEMDEE